jgi:hypothetical protein
MRVGDPEGPEELYFNGINGASGEYLLPPLSAEAVSNVAAGEKLDEQELAELQARVTAITGTYLGVVDGVDATKLEEAGWGVVYPHDVDPAVQEALKPLLDHRREQAAAVKEDRYREFSGPDGHRPGERSSDFLVRHGVAPGMPVDPDKTPYYMLLVGDPERIPYRFQYQLDVTFAAGRIHFDSPEEYARYAESVVEAEQGTPPSRDVVLFGVRNQDDKATTMSADELVGKLGKPLSEEFGDWSFQSVIGKDQATKGKLTELLHGGEPPRLLFTASHGMAFPNGDSRQAAHQGALLCQEWPGPFQWHGPISQDHYFAADDVRDDARVGGMLAFFFACYGAGTPKTDDFAQQALGAPAQIAPHAFIGRLPQRLLAHPQGGALAVVGHVERAWSYSFTWPRIGRQLQIFDSTLGSLLRGIPLGQAVEYFNDHYAALTTELESLKEDMQFGAAANPAEVSGLWTAKNDARNYVILGDPAVRLTA